MSVCSFHRRTNLSRTSSFGMFEMSGNNRFLIETLSSLVLGQAIITGHENQEDLYATGDYITFIDSDDYVMPDMIESLMNIIAKENTDIAQCNFIRSKNDFIGAQQHESSKSDKFTVYFEDKMSAYLKENKINTVAWGKIYKRSLFDEIRFPVGRLHEDVFTTYKLIHKAESVAVADSIGYIYRVTENSITTSKFTPKKLDSVYGKLEQSECIEKYYPNLKKYAYSAIIYACNQCLLQMAKSRYKGENEYAFLQVLYRQYGKHYIGDKVSVLGKVVTILAMINVHLAKSALLLKRQDFYYEPNQASNKIAFGKTAE